MDACRSVSNSAVAATRDDVKIAYKDGLDFIALDGSQGGTGAASDEVAEYVGIPSMAALMEAVDGLEEIDAGGQLPIVLMGGIQDGIDVAKAIALGASARGPGHRHAGCRRMHRLHGMQFR